MSNLPEERLTEEPPFSYCGVDMFGPFLVKEGRNIHERYGAIFPCLFSRAVHIVWKLTALLKHAGDSSVGEEILGLFEVTMVATSLGQALS